MSSCSTVRRDDRSEVNAGNYEDAHRLGLLREAPRGQLCGSVGARANTSAVRTHMQPSNESLKYWTTKWRSLQEKSRSLSLGTFNLV